MKKQLYQMFIIYKIFFSFFFLIYIIGSSGFLLYKSGLGGVGKCIVLLVITGNFVCGALLKNIFFNNAQGKSLRKILCICFNTEDEIFEKKFNI